MSQEQSDGPIVELTPGMAPIFTAMAVDMAQALNDERAVVLLIDGTPVNVHSYSPSFGETFRVISEAYQAALAHQIASSPAGMIQ